MNAGKMLETCKPCDLKDASNYIHTLVGIYIETQAFYDSNPFLLLPSFRDRPSNSTDYLLNPLQNSSSSSSAFKYAFYHKYANTFYE